MRKILKKRKVIFLLSIWISLGFLHTIKAQSPHGESFKVDCATCHTPLTWEIDIDTFKFDHDTTRFALEGVHLSVDCKTCHTTLLFDEAPTQCIACHSDVHSMSVGNDCARCHTSENWLVDNIPELHEANGFPLVGSHGGVSCVDCHFSENQLRFDRIGNDCVSCHFEDFQNTMEPNHEEIGFSTNCSDCHDPFIADWNTTFINHDFFPLTEGHDIQDCAACHNLNDYSDISAECIACHKEDFQNTVNPDHQTANFSTDCASCHTTDLNWMPASYLQHDAEHFPIYSGEHQGEWNDCVDCHLNPNNFAEFTCVACHTNPETDNEHQGIPGYRYEDSACLACHPNGEAEGDNIDHDANFFPIYSGSHEGEWNDCIDCHTNPDNFSIFTCVGCHVNPETDDFHVGVPSYQYEDNACLACHPTGDADIAFDHNTTDFPLTGAHITVDCIECHADGFEGTSTACVDCHTVDYNNTTNPNHTAIGISTDCISCHTTDLGWKPATFDIHDNYYPLTGGHASVSHDCAVCHNGDYNNTPNTCVACHQADFNNATQPNHQELGLSTDCASCHTTALDWTPASFDVHDEYYPLNGAHASVDCASCHTNGNYANTPNTCIGCHQSDYNNASPNHNSAGFPTDCLQCHNETAWEPSTFNHDDQYFPIYSGEHQGEWDKCTDCHINTNDYSVFSCINCHEHSNKNEVDDDHNDVNNYTYESNACFSCHPDGKE